MDLVDIKEIFYVERTIKIQPTCVDISGDLVDQELVAIMIAEEYGELIKEAMYYYFNKAPSTFDIEGKDTRGTFIISTLNGEEIVPTDMFKVTIGIRHVAELCL